MVRSKPRRRWVNGLWGIALVALGCADGEPAGPLSADDPLSAGYADPVSAPAHPAFQIGDVGTAAACAGCHPRHYEQWRTSSHARAMEDPVFLALIERLREDVSTEMDRFCTQCHSSIGTRSGDILPGFELAELSDVSREGVTCESCHRIQAVTRANNAGHLLDTAGPVQGPRAGASATHEVSYNPLFSQSILCGTCHDVATAATMLESPYSEWRTSPSSRAGQTCQDCHMPSDRGPIASLPGRSSDETVHRHEFVGAGVPVGGDASERAASEARSLVMLRGAVSVEVDPIASRRAGDEQTVVLTVASRVGGHRVPTGSSFYRQLWLALEVTDADGVVMYESGRLAPDGELCGQRSGECADPALRLFGAHLLDAQGRPTDFPWRAVQRRDDSLLPYERRRLSYTFSVPAGSFGPFTVRARLRYRSFPPQLLRELDLSDLVPDLVVLDAAEAEAVLQSERSY